MCPRGGTCLHRNSRRHKNGPTTAHAHKRKRKTRESNAEKTRNDSARHREHRRTEGQGWRSVLLFACSLAVAVYVSSPSFPAWILYLSTSLSLSFCLSLSFFLSISLSLPLYFILPLPSPHSPAASLLPQVGKVCDVCLSLRPPYPFRERACARRSVRSPGRAAGPRCIPP